MESDLEQSRLLFFSRMMFCAVKNKIRVLRNRLFVVREMYAFGQRAPPQGFSYLIRRHRVLPTYVPHAFLHNVLSFLLQTLGEQVFREKALLDTIRGVKRRNEYRQRIRASMEVQAS